MQFALMDLLLVIRRSNKCHGQVVLRSVELGVVAFKTELVRSDRLRCSPLTFVWRSSCCAPH